MTGLTDALASARDDLTALNVRFAVVGGLAVSARTEPRFTRDVDLALAVESDAEAERIVRELGARGYVLHALVEQEALMRLATARLSSPTGAVIVDLLFASSGIEPEIVAEAEELQIIDGLELPVASVAHLIATKVLSRDDRRRPQDLADLNALLARADAAAVDRARQCLELIHARGYNRDRDLIADLSSLLQHE